MRLRLLKGDISRVGANASRKVLERIVAFGDNPLAACGRGATLLPLGLRTCVSDTTTQPSS